MEHGEHQVKSGNGGATKQLIASALDAKTLTAAGGILLSGLTIYLFVNTISAKFEEINITLRGFSDIQRENNQVQLQTARAIEANTRVMEQVLRTIR